MKTGIRRAMLVIPALLLLVGCSSTDEVQPKPEPSATSQVATTTQALSASATVKRVIDGDTIEVDDSGKATVIRLLNIDTPETKHPNKTVQCLGPEATEFLERKLPAGTQVHLEYDVQKKDKYDRTLAGVFLLDGEFVNEEIARSGFGTAVVFEPNSKFYARVLNAQNMAINTKTGLFSPDIACSIPAQINALQSRMESAQTQEELNSLLSEADLLIEILEKVPTDEAFAHLASYGATFAAQKQLIQLKDLKSKYVQTIPAQSAVDDGTAGETNTQHDAAEMEQLAAEQQAAAQRIAAEQAEAAQAEADRVAAEQVVQPEYAPAPAPDNPNPEPAQPAPQPTYQEPAPVQEPYPNYTGPRCYAPGGKTWKPCP